MFAVVFEYQYATPALLLRETLEEARECAHQFCPGAIRVNIYEHHPLITNPGTMEELPNERVERQCM